MQPQSPYGPPQPYNPQAQQGQGQPYNPNQPQQYPPAQPSYNGQPAPSRQINPGQPPMPVYVPPQGGRSVTTPQPDNLPPPPPAPVTPYDFFMEQPKPHASSNPLSPNGKRYGPADFAGSSKRNKILLAVVGAIVIIFLLALGAALLPKDETGPQWFAVAQRQQEVIRVCTLGTKAKYQTTRNFAITCQTGVTNSQRQLLAYMQKAGLDYNSKQLGLLANTKTDTRLKTASSSSTFDDVFREIMQQQLTAYNNVLAAQLNSTTGANGRAVLAKNENTVKLLLKMVEDTSDKTEAPAATD